MTATLADLRAALASANVQAFLRVIRAGETGQTDAAYRTMFGGGLFDSFADHPRQAITRGRYTSTAAGAYQFLSRTWDGLVKQYGFADFAPATQDLAAVALIKGRGALADVLAGRLPQAIAKCAREWASLPGSPYGQPVRTLAAAMATFIAAGGTLNVSTVAPSATSATPAPAPEPPPKESPMPLPLIIGALLPSLIEAIPKLGALFGSGSAVQERNVKAAELAVQLVQDATGARNAQEAVEMVKADPAVAQTAAKAIEDGWFQLTEVGGGIDAARKADAAFVSGGGKVWESPSFWAMCFLVPLVYLVVLSLIGVVGNAEWSPEIRASLAATVVSLVVGGAVGYYWGATTTRNRAPVPAGDTP
jgi:muramidase (phage lysozyme)